MSERPELALDTFNKFEVFSVKTVCESMDLGEQCQKRNDLLYLAKTQITKGGKSPCPPHRFFVSVWKTLAGLEDTDKVKQSFDLVERNLEDKERTTFTSLRSSMLSEHYIMTSLFGIHAGIPARESRDFYDCLGCVIAMLTGSSLYIVHLYISDNQFTKEKYGSRGNGKTFRKRYLGRLLVGLTQSVYSTVYGSMKMVCLCRQPSPNLFSELGFQSMDKNSFNAYFTPTLWKMLEDGAFNQSDFVNIGTYSSLLWEINEPVKGFFAVCFHREEVENEYSTQPLLSGTTNISDDEVDDLKWAKYFFSMNESGSTPLFEKKAEVFPRLRHALDLLKNFEAFLRYTACTCGDEDLNLDLITTTKQYINEFSVDYCLFAMMFETQYLLAYPSFLQQMLFTQTFKGIQDMERQILSSFIGEEDLKLIFPFFHGSHWIIVMRIIYEGRLIFFYADSAHDSEKSYSSYLHRSTGSNEMQNHVLSIFMDSPLWKLGEVAYWICCPNLVQTEDECGARAILHAYLMGLSHAPHLSLLTLHDMDAVSQKKLNKLVRRWVKQIMEEKKFVSPDFLPTPTSGEPFEYSKDWLEENALVLCLNEDEYAIRRRSALEYDKELNGKDSKWKGYECLTSNESTTDTAAVPNSVENVIIGGIVTNEVDGVQTETLHTLAVAIGDLACEKEIHNSVPFCGAVNDVEKVIEGDDVEKVMGGDAVDDVEKLMEGVDVLNDLDDMQIDIVSGADKVGVEDNTWWRDSPEDDDREHCVERETIRLRRKKSVDKAISERKTRRLSRKCHIDTIFQCIKYPLLKSCWEDDDENEDESQLNCTVCGTEFFSTITCSNVNMNEFSCMGCGCSMHRLCGFKVLDSDQNKREVCQFCVEGKVIEMSNSDLIFVTISNCYEDEYFKTSKSGDDFSDQWKSNRRYIFNLSRMRRIRRNGRKNGVIAYEGMDDAGNCFEILQDNLQEKLLYYFKDERNKIDLTANQKDPWVELQTETCEYLERFAYTCYNPHLFEQLCLCESKQWRYLKFETSDKLKRALKDTDSVFITDNEAHKSVANHAWISLSNDKATIEVFMVPLFFLHQWYRQCEISRFGSDRNEFIEVLKKARNSPNEWVEVDAGCYKNNLLPLPVSMEKYPMSFQRQKLGEASCIFVSLANALHYINDWEGRDLMLREIDNGFSFDKYKFVSNNRRSYAAHVMGRIGYMVQSVVDMKILEERSFWPTLCILRGNDDGTGHAVTTVENFIFDGNCPCALLLNANSLNWCCSTMEKKNVLFQDVPFAYRFSRRKPTPPLLMRTRDSTMLAWQALIQCFSVVRDQDIVETLCGSDCMTMASNPTTDIFGLARMNIQGKKNSYMVTNIDSIDKLIQEGSKNNPIMALIYGENTFAYETICVVESKIFDGSDAPAIPLSLDNLIFSLKLWKRTNKWNVNIGLQKAYLFQNMSGNLFGSHGNRKKGRVRSVKLRAKLKAGWNVSI